LLIPKRRKKAFTSRPNSRRTASSSSKLANRGGGVFQKTSTRRAISARASLSCLFSFSRALIWASGPLPFQGSLLALEEPVAPGEQGLVADPTSPRGQSKVPFGKHAHRKLPAQDAQHDGNFPLRSPSPCNHFAHTTPPFTSLAEALHEQRTSGGEYVFAAVDDHRRLACAEVRKNERKESTTASLLSALRCYRRMGIPVSVVMTDHAMACQFKKFQRVLGWLVTQPKITPPYTPRVNGKVERFTCTLLTGWAYAHAYPSSDERVACLPEWLHYYNRHRSRSWVLA